MKIEIDCKTEIRKTEGDREGERDDKIYIILITEEERKEDTRREVLGQKRAEINGGKRGRERITRK